MGEDFQLAVGALEECFCGGLAIEEGAGIPDVYCLPCPCSSSPVPLPGFGGGLGRGRSRRASPPTRCSLASRQPTGILGIFR